MVGGLKKSILSGPYVPTTVQVQVVVAAEGRPAVPQHTSVETTLNMTPENKEHFILKKKQFFFAFNFTSRDGESMESYYSRFYKLMNELTRNNLQVTTMQVNVQYSSTTSTNGKQFSLRLMIPVLKKAKSAKSITLIAAAQPYSDNYYQAPKPQRSNAMISSTRPSASTRHKGKEIAKPITPQFESVSVSDKDSDPEQAQRDKEMQKNLAAP
ncbi:hypothetical protein Tco_0413054 [Tanacetum coccineum]